MTPRSERLSWMVLGVALLWLGASLWPPRDRGLDLAAFARWPVLSGGRVKPLDTVARSALLILRGKQTLRLNGQTRPAITWLADMLYRQKLADDYPVFEIDDPDVLGLMGIQQGRNRHYSFNDLRPHLQAIEVQAARAEETKAEQRTRFQTAVSGLQQRLLLYQKLQNTVQVAGREDVVLEYRHYVEHMAPALGRHMAGGAASRQALVELARTAERYRFMADVAEFYPVPAARGLDKAGWMSVGQNLLDAMTNPTVHPATEAFAAVGDAWRAQDAGGLAAAQRTYTAWLEQQATGALRRGRAEHAFNASEPFYKAMVLYVLAFLLISVSWLVWGRALNQAAFAVIVLAFAVHTLGLVTRMILQGRPPVTNLYSSAIFVGWAAVLLGLFLERLYRNGLAGMVSSGIGFVTLIIAHHLAAQGDTLEMMRAVLDSNFWLATHVVTITVGYSSTFLSGALGMVYVLRRAFDKGWTPAAAATLERMIYGVVCFSAFFSFLGTILGGIWADQSWGRFWGWDPKENGALMIVLWNSFILHARVGGFLRPRYIAVLAVFGNIVTAFSWFGVNMLGIGLHSYGFMDKAFWWLVVFAITQAIVIAFGLLPDYMTRRAARSSR
jgi:ABC-type transport system involved in cytochrome c biogenesis permease subunit